MYVLLKEREFYILSCKHSNTYIYNLSPILLIKIINIIIIIMRKNKQTNGVDVHVPIFS